MADLSEIFDRRLKHYRKKMARADALAEDTYTRWEVLEHTITAIEYLASECGIEVAPVPRNPEIG